MKISHLRVSNFRSIQYLDTELPQVCALVGPNNAGKSNIMLAMQRVLEREWISASSFGEEDVYGRRADLDTTIELAFDPPLPYKKFKNAPPVEVASFSFEFTRYKMGDQKGYRRLEQRCLAADGSTPMVLMKAPKKGEAPQYQPLVNVPSEVREQVPLIYIGTNRSLREQLPSARYSLLRSLFDDINRDFHDPAQVVAVTQKDGSQVDAPRADRFQKHIDAAMRLLRTEEFELLESSIKNHALRLLGFDTILDANKLDLFFSPFDTLDFYRSLDLRVREGDFAISGTELGQGMQNALVLAILQAFEERKKQGAILLIEEPEMFLHPQMQRSLYKTLREIGKVNQVIYTTHSPHFVSVPDYRDVVLVRKNEGGTFVRQSDLPSDQKRREKMIKELDPERSELFFATRLLLVEGDTEKLAIPAYALHLGVDLDRQGISIVEVGGKRNLVEFVQIARSFQIPTGVLYDEDSSDFDDASDEADFNSTLDGFQTDDGAISVWKMARNYEDELRKALGEPKYQELCQRYPKVAKPTRARLIALEPGLDAPTPIRKALNWLLSAGDAELIGKGR